MILIEPNHLRIISTDQFSLDNGGSDRLYQVLGYEYVAISEPSPYEEYAEWWSVQQPFKDGSTDFYNPDPLKPDNVSVVVKTSGNEQMPYGEPPLILGWTSNPFNVSKISDNAYVPNFRIPLRFYSNPENTRGDYYWNLYWTGGEFDGVVYPPLVDEAATYTRINGFTYLPYRQADIEREGLEFHETDALLRRRVYSVRCNYNGYDYHVQNRMDYENQLDEKELPNWMWTLDKMQWGRMSLGYGRGYDTIATAMEGYSPQLSTLNRFYLQNSIPASRTGADFIYSYFCSSWPDTWQQPDVMAAKEHAGRYQENLIFDDSFFRYYGNKPETWLLDRAANDGNKRIVTSTNPYNITVRFTPSKNTSGTIDEPTPGMTTVIPFINSAGAWKGETHGYNVIRDIIQRNDFDSQFMEFLKDLEEGSLPDFPTHTIDVRTINQYSKMSGDASNTMDYDEWFTEKEKYGTAMQTTPKRVYSSENYKCYDFLHILGYAYNNPTVAVNDNYTFLGPPMQQQIAMIADNTTYRYLGMTNLIGAMDDTIDYLQHYYDFYYDKLKQTQFYTKPSSYSEITTFLFRTKGLWGGPPNDSRGETPMHPIAYRIDKFEATPEGKPSGKPIQKFWYFNSYDTPQDIDLVDTQVKYGKGYVYRCTAYMACLASTYSYTNLRITKQIGKYSPSEMAGTVPGISVPAYCVQFYNPYTDTVADQTLTSKLASPDIDFDGFDVTYQTTALSDFNISAGLSQDFIIYPQAADLYLNIQPSLKIIEIPQFEQFCGVYDNPCTGLTVEPFHFMDDTNRLGFSVKGDPWKEYYYPPSISPEDRVKKFSYLQSKELTPTQLIKEHPRSPPRYLEMYRLSKKPTGYSDFHNNLVSRIDLRIPEETMNVKDYIAVDKIRTNKTYYYLFRFVSESNMPSWPSPIIEARLVDDGGYKYSLFEHMNTEEFVTNPYEKPSTTFKKLFQLEPNVSQLKFNTVDVDFERPANTQLNNIKVGSGDEVIWNKKFKIRLTSKKTGKKIDLNVTYEVENIDMSSPESYIPNPPAEAGTHEGKITWSAPDAPFGTLY